MESNKNAQSNNCTYAYSYKKAQSQTPPPKNKKNNTAVVSIIVAVALLIFAAVLNIDKDGNDLAVSDSTLSTGITEACTQTTVDGDSTQATAAVNSGKTAVTNKATNAVANKTAARQSAAATTVRLANLSSEFANNLFVNARHVGGCDTLTGNMKVTFVFVNDSVSSWDSTAMAEAKTNYKQAMDSIVSDAKKYGQTLNISIEYKTATASGKLALAEDYNSWANSALSSAGLPALSNLNNSLESRYGVKEAPVVLCVNRTGRSFATQNQSGEFVALYGTGAGLIHEMYHLFGAEDYYFPASVKSLANSLFPNSIMLTSEKYVVDSLTAYLIGWTDTPSADAITFLKSTNSITEEQYGEEYEKQTYTGTVTNYQMSGGVYSGTLVEGVIDGEGTYTWESGACYSGSWKYGVQHGQGTYTYTDGSKYVGAWVDGKLHGQGTYTYADGSKYVGNWVEDKRSGQGTMTWADGSKYVGAWVDGERTGQGTFTWTNGASYTGGFKNGKLHGQGTYAYADGSKYVGNWVEDKRSGQGTMTWADGSNYVGAWVNGQRTGQGTFTWANGTVYTGGFKDGKLHGQGTCTWPNGATQSGTWENDKFLG